MKKMDFLKVFSAICLAAVMIPFAGCTAAEDGDAEIPSSSAVENAEQAETESYKIAIVKQLDHASLDEIAVAISGELDAISAENGVEISYEVFSGQGDQATLTQIGTQLIAEEYDAIIPIATLAAQIMTVAAEESETPVIFAGVSDPEAAELIDIPYVTGISDALSTNNIMDMILAFDEDIQNVGLLYSLSEINSTKPIAEAKAYLDGKGISYTEKTANTNDEVVAAAGALIAEGVDAIFTPTDNIIMAAELAIYEDLANAKIPHYTGADSFVRNGAFATMGVNYTALGIDAANYAYQAVVEGMDEMQDYYLMDGGIITVNTETATAIEGDYSVFNNLGEVVEVVTTAE